MDSRTETGHPARDAEGQTARSAPRPLSVITLAVVGALLGLAVVRFLVMDGSEPAPTALPPAVAGATVPERIASLEQSLETDPDQPSRWRELAALLVSEAATTGDPTFHTRAQDAVERARDLGDTSIDLTIVDATLQLSLHQFDRARALARDALERAPDSAAALGALVDAEVETGQYEQAAENLQRMLDLRPALPALARTSYLRELNGDLAGAARAMQQAVTAGSALPDQLAQVQVLLGDLQRRLGDDEAARRALAAAETLRDDLPIATVLRARLAIADGDLRAAIDGLTDLTDRIPLPDALTLLEEAQAAAGDTAAAADTAEVIRTIATLQEDAGQDTDLELARFEADAGDPAEAVELATQAYASRPTTLAASALGWALHRDGDTDAALPYVRESIRLGTTDAALGYRAAAVLQAAGQTEEARGALALALEDVPSSTPRFADDVRMLAEQLGVELPAAWS